MINRESGVLLNISSLPGRYGIGKFGAEAVAFAHFLKSMGFSRWQVLPFNPVGPGDCPYASPSAFGGNMLYISPDMLCEDGYVTPEDIKECIYYGSPHVADYEFAARTTKNLLEKAYAGLTEEGKSSFYPFLDEQVQGYCKFLALKEKHDDKPFPEWGEDAYFEKATPDTDRVNFYAFCQSMFFDQWARTKKEINQAGIKIIGDIPIYVYSDSADVWQGGKVFKVNNDFSLSNVAGAPPDYFSEDGQLWGNPLYDWDYLASTGYDWWCKRIKASMELYDTVRIDHFRGLASYWSVDGKEETARNGKWEKGPGIALFESIEKAVPEADIIAEDLGEFGEDVIRLLEDTGYAGMRIIQFGFTPNDNSSHTPHNYPENSVAYTGTHDNDTLLGWLYSASPEEREFALKYCRFEGGNWGEGGVNAPAVKSIIETLWRSNSFLAILPVQDMLGFGEDARMNRPGVPEGQWRFRATQEFLDAVDRDRYSEMNRICFRYNKNDER